MGASGALNALLQSVTKLAALLAVLLFSVDLGARAADVPIFEPIPHTQQYTPQYRWTVTPVDGGSEILTLIGRFNSPGQAQDEDVPLVSILRDRIPGGDSSTDRLRYVWLLTYQSPRFYQTALSAVPFFYWHSSAGADNASGRVPKPLLDLSAPAHHVFANAAKDVVQWGALDPMTMAIRASSRAYGSNSDDHERLHVEEAISFLREAPVADARAANDETPLTRQELNSVIARLTLTKTLLGGFVSEDRLGQIAAAGNEQRLETIGRNWELLRTSAERTGLLFEPLKLADSAEQYAVLWFPLERSFTALGISLGPTWKLLHISNPWTDARLKTWEGFEETRYLDASGGLLAESETSPTKVTLVPLAVYSLTYPGAPLLLVDFRHGQKRKQQEMLQRATNELAMGVLALSHFANWYYFAGQSAYHFVKTRHGSAENLSARLDAYSEFRVAVTLDKSVDPEFRQQLQRRVEALDVNPLGDAPAREVALASRNFEALQQAAADNRKLPAALDERRRAELFAFGKSPGSQLAAKTLHVVSFGLYSDTASRNAENLIKLERDRKMESLTAYLEKVRDAGPRPEVSYPPDQIQASMKQLSELISASPTRRVRDRAKSAVLALQKESKDDGVLATCKEALTALDIQKRSPQNGLSLAALPRASAYPTRNSSLTAK